LTSATPSRGPGRAFVGLYLTTGIVVLIQSVQTIVAAIVFLIPRTMRIGALGLLVILAFAFGLHALRGDLALSLLVYAAAVSFVWVHGATWPRG
jgi:hypothetical protein